VCTVIGSTTRPCALNSATSTLRLWLTGMYAVWQSNVDRWVYQARPRERRREPSSEACPRPTFAQRTSILAPDVDRLGRAAGVCGSERLTAAVQNRAYRPTREQSYRFPDLRDARIHIRDLGWMLDCCCGHDWALSNVSAEAAALLASAPAAADAPGARFMAGSSARVERGACDGGR
jgi:hypothetical protein